MINWSMEAISSFQEFQRIVKYPTTEAEYLEWVIPHSGSSIIKTWAEVQSKATELEAAYDALEYSRLRKAKYDLLNQDEMRYDDLVNNTTTWRDGIAAIKTAHPKP
jgi:hypothetical protein